MTEQPERLIRTHTLDYDQVIAYIRHQLEYLRTEAHTEFAEGRERNMFDGLVKVQMESFINAIRPDPDVPRGFMRLFSEEFPVFLEAPLVSYFKGLYDPKLFKEDLTNMRLVLLNAIQKVKKDVKARR